MKKVIKRNGDIVDIDLNKIKKVVASCLSGLEDKCNPLELETDSQVGFSTNMSTKDIQKLLIQTAVDKISLDVPEWQFAAARLMLCDISKNIILRRDLGSDPYSGFYEMIKFATESGIYSQRIMDVYSKEEILELESYIEPERDLLFNYAGLKTLKDRYLLRDYEGSVLEMPQECFMGVAMFLALNEKDKVKHAKDFYDVMSKFEVMVATPTLSNARRPLSQLSSCFVTTVDDSLTSIMENVNNFSQLSKYGGGVGTDMSKLRSQGSEIRNVKNVSGGVVPWIRILNDTAVAVDQLGVRKGALTINLNIYHADIYDFLDLKTNNGDDRRKAHDIFPQVGIPDNFMHALANKEKYYLFDPYMVKKHLGFEISDYFGEEFTEKYNQVLKCDAIEKTEVPAVDLFKKLVKSCFTTGLPYVFYRDTANRGNPNKHKGIVRSTNLCVEIIQNMEPSGELETFSENGVIKSQKKSGDLVVCNLSSINLSRVSSDEDLERVIPIQVRMLDNVIDLNFYPLDEAQITNSKYRAIGLGTMGYNAWLAKNTIRWESQQHLDAVDKLYEKIAYETIRSSSDLAVEKGSYSLFEGSDWQKGEFFGREEHQGFQDWASLKEKVREQGLRNGYLLATAPTGSISIITGTTAGIDPIFQRKENIEKKDTIIPYVVPFLNEGFFVYKAAHNIDQQWVIDAASVRQKWIDQSQSLNLFVRPDLSSKEMLMYYFNAWKKGCKTVYYMRSKSIEVDECESCAS